MDEARRRLPSLVRPTWILAHEQTSGRGRRGRPWRAPKGHFAATLAFRPLCGAAAAAQRSFLMANALYESLALWVNRARLSVKWPNDVLLDDGKVAGILLESAGSTGLVDWLCIGVGVNLDEVPPDDGNAFAPVSLGRIVGHAVDPEDFLDVLATSYATQEGLLAENGFQPIRRAWLQNAARLGEIITARTGADEITGRFETVDEAGNLVLSVAGARQVVAAADIFF